MHKLLIDIDVQCVIIVQPVQQRNYHSFHVYEYNYYLPNDCVFHAADAAAQTVVVATHVSQLSDLGEVNVLSRSISNLPLDKSNSCSNKV